MKTQLCAFVRLFLFVSILYIDNSLAVDSESSREAIVSSRNRKFYKSSRDRQYLALSGNVDSDHNSKDYEFGTRYLYHSDRFINNLDFSHEVKYRDLGTRPGKTVRVKRSELYDLSLSSKAKIFDTNNYAVFYHRTIYDDMSKYYYDLRTAAGVGRMFFKDALEIDFSLGYHDVKTYGNNFSVIPSFRFKKKITDKLRITQRGYLFIDHESMDNEIRTSLIYKLSKKVSFEIRHTFEQRRYERDEKRVGINQVRRLTTIGLIFDLS